MGGEIDAGAPLDYAAFQIFPTQNRYEAFVFVNKIVENLADGALDKLALHLPELEDLKTEGSDASFRLELPQTLSGVSWFTKSIVNRFLNIVGSPDLFNIIKTVEDEVSQLEKARQFHHSLYAKGDRHHQGNGEADGSLSNLMAATIKPEVNNVSSQASKSELLRAMDLRVTALKAELVAAFNRAAGGTCSAKNINDLEKFSDHFGATNLKEFLCKVLQLGYNEKCMDSPSDDKSSVTSCSRDNQYKTGGSPHSSNTVHSTGPVMYGVSPSKVAQVERQSSTDSEESSDPSDEDPTSAERSRTLVRSASPRRSSSPMRRVQIGRSGSRRASALTIKSLGYFPARDKAFLQRDAAGNSSGEEENSEQVHKKTENKVQRRMSVQDAISLFERKQEDKIADIQQKKSPTDIPVNAKKFVLRRWSSGMGESSSSIQSQPEAVSEECAVMAPAEIGSTEVIGSSTEEKPESVFISAGANPIETANMEETQDKRAQQSMDTDVDMLVTQKEPSNRLETSVKWNQQKEAELNCTLMQMTVNNNSKPVKSKNPKTKKNINVSSEQRGGFYDHYKEKRDGKLRGENAGKRAEKEAKLKEMQQTINDRKAEMVSKTVTDTGKKLPLRKPLSSNKIPSQDANPKREISKPSITKRNSSKSSPLPAVRKSWPSTPLPRTTEIPTTKASSKISPSTAPVKKKSQPAATVTRLSPKTEKPLPINKPVKGNPSDINKSINVVNDKPQRLVTQSGKTTKAKDLTASVEASTVPANPTLYSKMTKKSSVVPLESKSFTRKGSEDSPTTMKTKPSCRSEESPQNSKNMSRAQQNDDVTNTSVLINQQQVANFVTLETQDVALESENPTNSHQICSDTQNIDQVMTDGDECMKKMVVDSPSIVRAEEEEEEEKKTISPHAWEEREEVSEPPISHQGDRMPQLVALANVAPEALLNPRIRHSLSQMLQEEISEPDITEWGNAENPPSLIYQKDAPKGLKRLLKSGLSSANKYNAQNSLSRSQEGLIPSLPTTSKGTKSFFSLSAFRGSKSNETKPR